MRPLLVLLAVLVGVQSYITSEQKSDSPRVMHIPANPNAMMFLQSSQRRPYLKRRFMLPRMGMPTYVRDGEPIAPAWD
ncbi:hypothetical protein GCK32_012441 [Trichostrongylus colubriformis]|uniref:Uncharacterized protein n=1 Tax=Trichostrongylus colubriformis TaxID=6319 RepID=A0AAN8EXA5_TRICO